MTDYNYVVAEYQATPEFKQVVVAPVAAVLPAKTLAGGSPTLNDPIEVLTDGKVVMGFGPIFSNGDNVGMYKLDLANVQPVAQVNTWHALRDAARTACGRRQPCRPLYLQGKPVVTIKPKQNKLDKPQT